MVVVVVVVVEVMAGGEGFSGWMERRQLDSNVGERNIPWTEKSCCGRGWGRGETAASPSRTTRAFGGCLCEAAAA